MNCKVLNETETEPEVDYDDLEENHVVLDDNVYEGKNKTAEYPSFGSPREVNQIKTLTDHSSNTNIPFDCANSDSDTDSEISCSRYVRTSNSSDSSCTYYNPGFVSMMFGSDNGDHYTDTRSRQTVLRDDVRNTNYHGNTEHEHSTNGSSNDSLCPASSRYCSLNNKQNEHEHREMENNETHTLMSTSENDGSSDKSQKQPNNSKHWSRPPQYIAKATIANKETEPMNDDDDSSGNTSQTSSTYFITSPCAQSSSPDHDEQLPSRCVERFEQDRVLQHSSNMTSLIVHDASIRPIHTPNSHEGIELYKGFESTSNDKLFSPPSTENDDYLKCVFDV